MVSRRSFLQSALAGSAGITFAGALAAEEKSGPIRIGQIGVGHAHATKLSVYRRSKDYEVVGIVEPDESLRKASENHPAYKNVPWMTQEQLLNVPGLQAVLVETRVRDLLNTAEACIAAGKHIHLDKPAGESLPQFQRILQAADQKRLVVQMGYMFRYNPGIIKLREFLKNGWLGEIFEIHTVMSKVVPPVERKRLAAYRGGILFELGCHVVDLVIGLMGKPSDVVAFPQHVSSLDDGLLDSMLAVFRYEKATASVRSSAVEVDGGERRHFTVCGTEGTVHIQPLDNPRLRVAFSKPRDSYGAATQDVELPKYTRYVDDAADFARVLRGEKPHDYPSSHDLAVQETLLKACGLPIAD